MTEPIRVLDRRRPPGLSRRAARRSSSARPTSSSSARRTTGGEAVDLAAAASPAIILMDLRMPEMTRDRGDPPDPRGATRRVGVLILTMSEDDDSLFAAMRAGARGYIPKDADARSCSGRSGRRPSAR